MMKMFLFFHFETSRSSEFIYYSFLALCIFRLQYQDGTESVGSQQVSQWEATLWPRGVCLSSTLTPVWSGSSAPEHKTRTKHQVRELLVALERTLGFFRMENFTTIGRCFVTGGALDSSGLWCLYKSLSRPTRHSRVATLVCRDITQTNSWPQLYTLLQNIKVSQFLVLSAGSND